MGHNYHTCVSYGSLISSKKLVIFIEFRSLNSMRNRIGLVKIVVCLIGHFCGHISNTYVTNARTDVCYLGPFYGPIYTPVIALVL